MKIDFVSFANKRGGAAKAMSRLAELLNGNCYNIVRRYVEDENKNLTPSIYLFKRLLCFCVVKLMRTSNRTKHSLGLFSNRKLLSSIRNSQSDICHIHWVNNESLSIRAIVEISKLRKTVITLHDEWFYLGCQHYRNLDDSDRRFFSGNPLYYDFGKIVDLDFLLFFYKKALFKELSAHTQLVVPSKWMKDNVKHSKLLSNVSVRVIPNVIDVDVFFPRIAKKDSVFTIAFGAVDGADNPMKGYDLLVESLALFSKSVCDKDSVKIQVFGGEKAYSGSLCGFDVDFLGRIDSEIRLSEIYSNATIVIVPSRLESFGQVAAESISCGTPVVSFKTSGLKDIVEHKRNGYFAKPFDSYGLFLGMQYFYNMASEDYAKFSLNTRRSAIKKFSKKLVLNEYNKLYKELQ